MQNKNSCLCLTYDHQMDQDWIFAETELFKGSSDPSHLILQINVGKRRIRHKTTLNLNGVIFMSDPTLS